MRGQKPLRVRSRRIGGLLLIIAAFAGLTLFTLVHLDGWLLKSQGADRFASGVEGSLETANGAEQAIKAADYHTASRNVTKHFRDNLDPSSKYVTAFVSAGLANQIISLLHLLQIAIHTHSYEPRIPVLPPFSPIHVNKIAGFIPFGDVFDIPRLSSALGGLQILEWRDIKHVAPTDSEELNDIARRLGEHRPYIAGHFGGLGQEDEIGCWSLIMRQMIKSGEQEWGPIWHGDLPDALSLDVSWTPIPADDISLAKEGTYIADLGYLASLGEEKRREVALSHLMEKDTPPGPLEIIPTLTDISRQSIEPDHQLLCFDFLFYTAFSNPDAISIKDDSAHTALDTIGIHLHFSRKLEDIALELLHHVLPPSSADPFPEPDGGNRFPPYIAVHIRRNDFEQYCPQGPVGGDRSQNCFTPLSEWEEAVSHVRADLLASDFHGLSTAQISSLPILIFSDEPKRTTPWFLNRFHRPAGSSEAWWTAVDDLGWISIDHQSPEAGINTEERWGYWYPILLDQVLMSHAVGYVGTEKSTFSLMAAKRVEGWWEGPVRMVMPVVPGVRVGG